MAMVQKKERTSAASSLRTKLLTKDRKIFLQFCQFLRMPDCALHFESALAMEVPLDLDELKRSASHLAKSGETGEILFDFVSLVLGHDVALETREDPGLLRKRWLERSTNANDVSAVPFSVFDAQIRSQQARITALEVELAKVGVGTDVGVQTLMPVLVHAGVEAGDFSQLLRQPVADALEKAAATHAQELLEISISASAKSDTIKLLKSEADTRKAEVATLKAKVQSLQSEMGKFAFVEEIAAKQAQRDAEIASLRRQLAEDRRPALNTHEHCEFLKNILIRFMSYAVVGDYEKMATLIPVLKELLVLSNTEAAELLSVCQPPRLLSLFPS